MSDSRQSGTPPPDSGTKKGGLWSHWPNMVGWAISGVALAYVLSQIRLSELRKDLSGITWWLVVAAIVLEVVPRLLEAVRWRSLLRPICTRFADLLQAIYIGTVYSSILPLSGGDVVRGVIVARRAAANLIQVLSTELVERVVDALAIILLVWFALRGLALPQALRVVRILLEVGVGLAIAFGLLVIVRRVTLMSRLGRWTPANQLSRRIRSVGLDLVRAIGWARPRAVLVAMGAALAAAIANVAAYWLMLRAYNIHLSLIQAAGLFAIVMIGTFLPGTPGNVGSWQFFCTIGLQLFGIGAAKAAGFSIVAYFIWTIPPLLIGLVVLATSPFSRSGLRRSQPEPSKQVGGVCEIDKPGKKRGTGGDES